MNHVRFIVHFGYDPLPHSLTLAEAMAKHLLLVDFENVSKLDLSPLDDSYETLIFVGNKQQPPKRLARQNGKFCRIDFQKIDGSGRNALDFHIAFHLGRTFETARDRVCFVLSNDKGYDPLLSYLNQNGLSCRRISSLDELAIPQSEDTSASPADPERTVCPKCKRASTIEHHGGRWCTYCGRFASPPDQRQLPSSTLREIRAPGKAALRFRPVTLGSSAGMRCSCCSQPMAPGDGMYDDGEWTCWGCVRR